MHQAVSSELERLVREMGHSVHNPTETFREILAGGSVGAVACDDPELAFTFYDKAYALFNANRFAEALPLFISSYLMDVRMLPALQGAASCLRKTGAILHAANCYFALLAATDSCQEVAVDLAECLIDLGHPLEASKVLTEFLAHPQCSHLKMAQERARYVLSRLSSSATDTTGEQAAGEQIADD